jgi:adenine phosphoribosyltransferase
MELKDMVRSIQDFPKPGVLFRDITTVLKEPDGLKRAADALAGTLAGLDFDLIIGPESRGFIFGMPLAYILGKGFVPARKAGKLPAETARAEYGLEYGSAEIEIHRDAIKQGQRVVLVDDLLATGGTAKAVAELLESLGATVVCLAFFIELSDLGGRAHLVGRDVRSVLVY